MLRMFIHAGIFPSLDLRKRSMRMEKVPKKIFSREKWWDSIDGDFPSSHGIPFSGKNHKKKQVPSGKLI